jgi:hypothetical protein
MSNNYLFCFGYGYVASKLADALITKPIFKNDVVAHRSSIFNRIRLSRFVSFNHEADASCTHDQLNTWKIAGTHTHKDIIFDENNTFDPKILDGVTHILISIPPNENGDIAYKYYSSYLEKTKSLKWVGYLSSTGVYGDHQGRWVDETSIPSPIDAPSKNRLMAENQWLSTNLPIHILRLSAIYGPERSMLDKLIKSDIPVVVKPGHYFSRMHIDDIVTTILKSILAPKPKSIYNLADNLPAEQSEVLLYLYKLLNKPAPEPIELSNFKASDSSRNFYLSNKRVSNNKILQEFNIQLKYQTYREGYSNILELLTTTNMYI